MGGWEGSRGSCGASPRLSDAPTGSPAAGSPLPTGTAASQGFRTAHGFQMGRMASDVPHRRAMRSWPKALGIRLYGSLSRTFGIKCRGVADSLEEAGERPFTFLWGASGFGETSGCVIVNTALSCALATTIVPPVSLMMP